MFRTRDFVLIFTVIVFLIMAISATVLVRQHGGGAEGPKLTFVDADDVDYEAQIYAPETLTREERLERMRQKIAEGGEIVIRQPEPEVPEEETGESEQGEAVASAGVRLCAGHRVFTGMWPFGGAKIDVVEGARIAYQEVISEYELDPLTATSGTLLPPESKKDVLLELSIRSFSSGQQNCLATDVVGIAQDGSLIRYTELGLYSVFGESTVIGYSLDGFPIHGLTSRSLDACGGAVVNGQYGYYLSTDREAVLECFSATPASL